MKLYRSTKLNFKFATKHKMALFASVLKEYSAVVNFFIHHFWENTPMKVELLKPIVDLPDTWLSFTMRQIAAREAIDMINACRKKKRITMPIHRGNRIQASSLIASLQTAKTATGFDLWLHLRNIGNHIILDIPVKLHKHYHRLLNRGRQLNSYVLSKGGVQLCFEIKTDPKKEEGKILGLDTGIKTLATLSDGRKFGQEIETIIERINRCRHGSKHQKQLRRFLKHRMDEVCKEIYTDNIRLIVIEKLKNMQYKMRLKRRLSKNMRRVVGSWAYRYWLDRLKMGSEDNRVVFRSVPARNTSIMCSACDHTDKKNRQSQETFLCQNCGHSENADVNAAKNILAHFLSGPYGAGFKVVPTGAI